MITKQKKVFSLLDEAQFIFKYEILIISLKQSGHSLFCGNVFFVVCFVNCSLTKQKKNLFIFFFLARLSEKQIRSPQPESERSIKATC